MPSLTSRTILLTSILAVFPFLSACDGQADDDDAALPAYEQFNAPAGDSVTEESVEEGAAAISEPVSPDQIPESDIPPPPNREVFSDESCDFEAWVGKPLDEGTIKGLNRPTRILKPGGMMTMDHNPMRVNVEHEDGTVTRVWCG